ncbi:GRIP1-associated protein 1 isoform X2 [Anolis carolinensis]|uniref:GRIP1 associated protein 1 n=1 Tax=Anolis carolinensis TaxID=28377 RepID=A0A803TFU2_ANOCA|nr:PREDICTED: GRIP1-associated protein 1 isoform X2 [Anolis carolinensis]|eukprot:XP_008116590.1 PREDICTED: GRIP1-associated protein 1 isoform X2 [Anolis carolinensis]
MAQALSGEEFERMQTQLLELRTQNYQLSDELRKNTTELNGLRQRVAFLDKELAKSQKALSKSKKAQEVDALLSENEMLQGKLHSQEDDFRLQNSTLMQELSKLCTQIEQLEKENKTLREGGSVAGTGAEEGASPASPVDGELLRLQAENSALQKNMAALQERYEKEVARQAENRGGGKGDASLEPPPSGQESVEPQASDGGGGSTSQQLLSEVELKWQMEREEKILLKEQLQNLETSKTTEMSRLQQELSKLAEKLKKKQESFLRLQTEKEALYNDSRTKIEEIQQRKEEDLKSLQIRNQKLQQELQTANQGFSELKDQLQSRRKEHEVALQALHDQIQTSKTQEMNLMRDQVATLGAELQQCQNEKETLAAQRDDLNTQLQESLRANTRLLEQLQELGQEKDRLLQDLDETRKTAEKRKAMLDEMAIETLQEKGRHKEEISNLRLQHEKEVLAVRARYERELRELHEHKKRQEDELRGQLKEEKARSQELESMQQTVEELRLQIQSMEGTKGWFERRLKDAEELIEKHQQEHAEALQACKEQHLADLQLKDQEVEASKEKLREIERARDEHIDAVNRLKQEVKDTVDGQRILEKKGSAALKDLKRQLHLERKRADKLQERLQEILTNSKSRTGIEDLVLADISSPSRAQTGDSSSISSFSYREIMKEGSGAGSNKSTTGSPQSQSQPPRPADLSDEEISELFQRLAEVQQEKWLLEEKVKHLEVSSASMAEDLCRKSAIIETYVMDSRIDVSGAHGQVDRSSLSSVLRDLVKPGDENLREMNKKLQNMLEEQLTKNMHLQKDLEVLSQEIVRLSKECVPSPDAEPALDDAI